MSIQKIINKFRKDLKKKKPLVGGWMQISNSNLVELMCSSPYEWIAFDMELRRAFIIKNYQQVNSNRQKKLLA